MIGSGGTELTCSPHAMSVDECVRVCVCDTDLRVHMQSSRPVQVTCLFSGEGAAANQLWLLGRIGALPWSSLRHGKAPSLQRRRLLEIWGGPFLSI